MPRANKELSLFLWDPFSRHIASFANRWTSFIPPPPRHPSEAPRRVLLLHAHPLGAASFNGACFDTAHRGLQEAGHEVKTLKLYDDKFQPCMQPSDIKEYFKPLAERNEEGTPDKAALLRYVDLLKWCDALVFVYPTWWYAMPAILKGWIERTFVPHSTFTLPSPSSPPPSIVGLVPCLQNIKKVGVVTTYGSSYGVIRYVGDPGRRIIARGLRPLFSKDCTVLWLGMYSCDNATQKEREEFLGEVEAYMREF